jgi:hypothetical protein
VALDIETLDLRQLLSLSGFGPHLGHFVAPGVLPQSARQHLPPALTIDPHDGINRQLLALLGPGLNLIERNAELNNVSSRAALAQQVLGNAFIHAVYSDNDTWTVLNTATVNGVLQVQQLANNQAQIVTLTLPKSDVQLLGNPSVVQVQPGDPSPVPGETFTNGFILEVPATSLVFNSDNKTITIQVPLSQIPAQAQLLSNSNPNNVAAIYSSTAPLLQELFRSGVAFGAPTGLPTVPGLRLVNGLQQNNNFPNPTFSRFFHQIRFAAQKNLFILNADQQTLVANGLNRFLGVADNWNQLAPAQLNQLAAALPPNQLAPTPVHGSLRNTVAVTAGVLQQPNVVQTDFPERLDVGYIFARNGDYGIILTARGPLSNTPFAPPPNTIAAGDIQTEVSNATSLSQLNGWRIIEGTSEGSGLSGGVSATNANGVATFAASAGYGAGFEFGLGVRFSLVIPLGNVNTGPIP